MTIPNFHCKRWLIEVFHVEHNNRQTQVSCWFCHAYRIPAFASTQMVVLEARKNQLFEARIKFVSNLHYNSIQFKMGASCMMRHTQTCELNDEHYAKMKRKKNHSMCTIILSPKVEGLMRFSRILTTITNWTAYLQQPWDGIEDEKSSSSSRSRSISISSSSIRC